MRKKNQHSIINPFSDFEHSWERYWIILELNDLQVKWLWYAQHYSTLVDLSVFVKKKIWQIWIFVNWTGICRLIGINHYAQ